MARQYYVYILTNVTNHVLYIGVTNDLVRRIWEHRNKLVKGFTYKYNVNKLVYYEIFDDIKLAITREKQLKGGSRSRKLTQIESTNPLFVDLYNSII